MIFLTLPHFSYFYRREKPQTHHRLAPHHLERSGKTGVERARRHSHLWRCLCRSSCLWAGGYRAHHRKCRLPRRHYPSTQLERRPAGLQEVRQTPVFFRGNLGLHGFHGQPLYRQQATPFYRRLHARWTMLVDFGPTMPVSRFIPKSSNSSIPRCQSSSEALRLLCGESRIMTTGQNRLFPSILEDSGADLLSLWDGGNGLARNPPPAAKRCAHRAV